MSTEFEQSADLRPGLFPEETAEEAVARIVARNPQKHGFPVEERERRAKLAAIRESRDLSGLDADDALIVSVGGDPLEMMTGNKPRWTVDGDSIKDHLEGKEYGVIGFFSANTDDEHTAELQQVMVEADALANQATCAHSWPEDPDEETRCPLCQMTFADWVNS